MLAFSNDYYGMIFRATQSVELFCAYDNEVYDMILHLKWATDYGDIYDELKEQSKEHLLHQPPL